VKAKDMVLLGISLGTNKDFGKDHAELIKEFYAHVYKHRFMLSLEDKKALNSIFQ
jgi:citrate lyase gamma subunit